MGDNHSGGLSAQIRTFLKEYQKTQETGDRFNLSKAFRDSCPELAGKLKGSPLLKAAKRFLKRADVAEYLQRLAMSDDELAATTVRDVMVEGSQKERLTAAKVQTTGKNANKFKDATIKWAQIMNEIGAKVEIPGTRETQILDFSAFLDGRAQLYFPLAARLLLLEKAGAPWNNQRPDLRIQDHPVQLEFLERDERTLVLMGGSGVGKSVLGGCFDLLELMIPGRKIAIIGRLMDHAMKEAEYVWKGFHKLFPEGATTEALINRNKSKLGMRIKTIWGSEIQTYSLHEGEGSQVQGDGYDLINMAEADQVDHGTFTFAVQRAADRRANKTAEGYQFRTGRMLLFSTGHSMTVDNGAVRGEVERIMRITKNQPDKLHADQADLWAATAYIKKNISSETNPSYSDDTFQARVQGATAEQRHYIEEMWKGRAVYAGNRVLAEFDQYSHTVPGPSRRDIEEMRLVLAIDPGTMCGAVLLGLDKAEHVWVLGEHYDERASTRQNCENIKQMVMDILHTNQVDPHVGWKAALKLLDTIIIDVHCENKEDWEEFLDTPVDWSDQKDQLELTINRLRELFRDDRISVVDTCERFIWDAQKYNYRPNGRPGDKYNHLFDAMRYGLFGWLLDAGPLMQGERPKSTQDLWDDDTRKFLDPFYEDKGTYRPLG